MSALPDCGASWQARLALAFAPVAGRTVIARRAQHGPLTVQKAFYPEGAPAHVYLLHPPGGLVGGDTLDIALDAAPGSHALVTTPASGKVYRSAGPRAHQDLRIAVADEARLEWLPQDTIAFDGSDYAQRTTIELGTTARLVAREMIALGRPAHGDRYGRGRLDQALVIRRDGRTLLEERLRLAAPSQLLTAPWGLGGATVFGTLYACPADGAVLAGVRAVDAGPLRAAATLLDDLLCLRVLGDDATALRDYLARAWAALREAVIGCRPCPPRVWRT
ncbi:MAG: urease accessory protein UreD [Gammaproteobacteria bacterium]|nr:urease accessory protein UreD [Gammaproteobacteria bacterium]